MRFTLREMTRLRVPLLIWLMVSVVATVAGPFGTLDAMGVTGRALYWSLIAGGSIVLNAAAQHLTRDVRRTGRIAVGAGFVLVVSSAAHLANTLLFSAWGGFWDWAYLTGTVAMVTAAVHLVFWAIAPQDGPAGDDSDVFLRRLPLELRAPLVRIEAQDHYLKVVTQRGTTLILMRLSDAMAELSGQGLQVHRSHWVAVPAVTRHRREGARDLLVMADGAQVPVSRSFRAGAQELGLF